MPNPPLVLTMGDPAGCGPQITADIWRSTHTGSGSAFAIISDPAIFDGLCPVTATNNPANVTDMFRQALPVIPLKAPLPHPPIPGQADTAFAPGIIESIETAASLCLSGQVAAMVTNPISKAVLYGAGFKHPGHTEFIASLCETSQGLAIKPIMMLVGGGLRVALATIHIPLMQVGAILTPKLLIETAKIVTTALKQDFGFDTPRIAFSGLNPHAGEDGTIGSEEVEIINPAAKTLRAQGIRISDARPGDTVFHEALQGTYDCVIAMTHDQGLIPVKTLDMWGGVNTTIGLPIIRTSPDHGTAYEAAAAGTCRSDSLLAAIKLAQDMASNREQSL